MLVDALAIVLAWFLIVPLFVIRFVFFMLLVRHLVIRLNFFLLLVCLCTTTSICAQIQIDTWQIQTMEVPRYCDSDQILVASSPRIVIGAHLVTPPNLVASFFGK